MVGSETIYLNRSHDMGQPVNYIATWFYRESESEASFYPQLGQKGDSQLAHSVYMQIQVPFFTTFRHYNPRAVFLFFTNLGCNDLPGFLTRLTAREKVSVVTLSYTCRPPKGWYTAWQNQFYVYDILRFMGNRMAPEDVLLLCDADCLCRKTLDPLFDMARKDGSALYEFITDPNRPINGITLGQMEGFYEACYGELPPTPLSYYGGEFVALRGDMVRKINAAWHGLWEFNLARAASGGAKLNEEAHVLSILAARLGFRNTTANRYVKRMWTLPRFTNVESADADLSVWHLPYEKKRGLFLLFRYIEKRGGMGGEAVFWKRAEALTGVSKSGFRKWIRDRVTTLLIKLYNSRYWGYRP